MSKYDGKWILDITNSNELWIAYGFYNTKDEAIETGCYLARKEGLKKFRVGLCEDIPIYGIDVDQVIENIQNFYNDNNGYPAGEFLDNATTEQRLELENELNSVYFNWCKKHEINNDCFNVDCIEEIEI